MYFYYPRHLPSFTSNNGGQTDFILNIEVYWVKTLREFMYSYRCFGGVCRLHLHGSLFLDHPEDRRSKLFRNVWNCITSYTASRDKRLEPLWDTSGMRILPLWYQLLYRYDKCLLLTISSAPWKIQFSVNLKLQDIAKKIHVFECGCLLQ
jgi:hypothetical protein